MKLLIIGAGSFSTEVEELAYLLGYDEIAFLDDCKELACSAPVIGKISDASKYVCEYVNAVVALGNNLNREKYLLELKRAGFNIPVLIHPTAYVSKDSIIESGTIIRAMAVIGRFAEIGEGTIVNIGAKVDHHCHIGQYSHLQINSVVRNSQKIPPLTWVDSNCVIE